MEHNSKIARNYAQALFDALSPDQRAGANSILTSLSNLLSSSELLVTSLHNPAYSTAQRSAVLDTLIERAIPQGASSESIAIIKRLLGTMVENGRVGYLPTLASAFAELQRQAQGVVAVSVTSATALSLQEQDDLSRSLADKQGRPVVVSWQVDPALIGGLVLQCGDNVINCSIKGMLDKLRTEIIAPR